MCTHETVGTVYSLDNGVAVPKKLAAELTGAGNLQADLFLRPNKAALLRQPSTCAKKSLHTGISQGLPSVIPRHASTHSKVNSLVNSYVDERSGHSERPAIRR